MSTAQKISIFRDAELDPTGVTAIWVWMCPKVSCSGLATQFGQALFWDNIIRGANHHIAWHQVNDDQLVGEPDGSV